LIDGKRPLRSWAIVLRSLRSSQSSPWRPTRLGGRKLPLIAAVAGAVVVLDALTKLAATQFLSGEGKVEVLGGLFQLELYRNFAGPNDLFEGHTVLISLFAMLAVAVLVVVALRVTATLTAVAIGLLLGGAIGNLLDLIFSEPSALHGGVVDWLRITSLTKSMNLADLAIDAAIVLMLVVAVLSWGRDEEQAAGPPPRAGQPSD
jgi:signal peptidase II